MRRKDKEIKNRSTIDEIFTSVEFCRIAFFDREYPYIVPVNFGYSKNTIYFHSATSGKKIELLNKNPNVCVEITANAQTIRGENKCNWTTRYRSVIGYGKIEIIKDTEDKKKGMDIIMKQHGASGPFVYEPALFSQMHVMKISLKEITARQSGDWE